VDTRVHRAALEVYSAVGWAGFTFDAVAARAGVGKAAIYRRWPTKADMLSAAWLAVNADFVELPDTGSIRGDLVALAEALLRRLDGPAGMAEVRMLLDHKQFPEDFPHLDRTRANSQQVMRDGVARAVERGELPAGIRPEMLFDAVRGTIIHNFLFVPDDKLEVWRARRAGFAAEVVDLVLAGVRCASRPGVDRERTGWGSTQTSTP
jgi:AcrR family transcriptional regulator